MYEKMFSTLLRGCTQLTGIATIKDINANKTRINHMISTQHNQQETLGHVISILNITTYATQVNRQHINILMDKTEKMHWDITTLYNIMHSLYCYVRQCLVCVWVLSCLGVRHCIYEGALLYTMLIFGFPGLCLLRQYNIDKDATNIYMTLLIQLYISIITIPYNIHKYTLIC